MKKIVATVAMVVFAVGVGVTVPAAHAAGKTAPVADNKAPADSGKASESKDSDKKPEKKGHSNIIKKSSKKGKDGKRKGLTKSKGSLFSKDGDQKNSSNKSRKTTSTTQTDRNQILE